MPVLIAFAESKECPDNGGDDVRGMERPPAERETVIRQTNTTGTLSETATPLTHNDWGPTNGTASRREVTYNDGRAAAAAAHQSSTGEPIRCVTEDFAGGHECNHQRHHSRGKTLLAIQKAKASSIRPNCHAQNSVDNSLSNFKSADDSHNPENRSIEKENPNARTRQDDSSRASGPAHAAKDKLNVLDPLAKDDCSRQCEQNDVTRQSRHDLVDEHRRQLKLAHERVRNQCHGQAIKQVRAPMLHRPPDNNRPASHSINGHADQNINGRRKAATPTNSAAPRRSGAEWFEFNIARASSIGQLQSMRHRLKALLGQCEARIKTEFVKMALKDHLLGDDGPRAIACGDEGDVCCPLCLSTENDSRVSCPTCEQDFICKHCTATCQVCQAVSCLDCSRGCTKCGDGIYCHDCAGLNGKDCNLVVKGRGLCSNCWAAKSTSQALRRKRPSPNEGGLTSSSKRPRVMHGHASAHGLPRATVMNGQSALPNQQMPSRVQNTSPVPFSPATARNQIPAHLNDRDLQALLRILPEEPAKLSPRGFARHIFCISNGTDLGFGIAANTRLPQLTAISHVVAGSMADYFGIKVADIIVPPIMPSKMPNSHQVTREWFLRKAQTLPLKFEVIRKYGWDEHMDHKLEVLFGSEVMKKYHYSIHRIVVSEAGELGLRFTVKHVGDTLLCHVTHVEPGSIGDRYGVRNLDIICHPNPNDKGRKIIDHAHSWMRYYVTKGEHPYYFEVIRLHSVRQGEQPLIAARPNGHSYPQQHRQQHAAQQVTHQIQGQPTREEPTNPPNLNRALAPCPPPVADRNDPVDLTQDDSDSEENKKAESLAHSTNPISDKGIARLSHDPQSTSGHQSKASAGPLYGDDQRDELHNQPQADATPPNENKRLHGTTTGASDSQMTKRPITSFEDCLVALKAFKETSGHTNVQLRDDPGLAKFCDDLRWARSNPGRGLAVTNERVAALDELGFDWKGAEKQIKQADRNSEPQEEDNSGKSRAVPDGSLAAGSSLSNDKTIEPEEKAPVNSGRIKLGTKVSKMFVDNDRRRSFLGSVTGYDPETRLYRIVYEDRDTEDLFEDGVRAIMLKRRKLRVKRSARGAILASGTKRRVNRLASPTQGLVIVLDGTLTYCDQEKEPCYSLIGKWKCGKGIAQKFRLKRNLSQGETAKDSQIGGVFDGSFDCLYQNGNSIATETIDERNVNITFEEAKPGGSSYFVHGHGINKLGSFMLAGKATKKGTGTFAVKMTKTYVNQRPTSASVHDKRSIDPSGGAVTPAKEDDQSDGKSTESTKNMTSDDETSGEDQSNGLGDSGHSLDEQDVASNPSLQEIPVNDGGGDNPVAEMSSLQAHPLEREGEASDAPSPASADHSMASKPNFPQPENDEILPPAKIFELGVVSLIGKISPDNLTIKGIWAPSYEEGIEMPELCGVFEYKSESASEVNGGGEPTSGSFTGWIDEDDERIEEKDLTIQFKKNSEGYYNLEGSCCNKLGRYKLSGLLKGDGTCVLFKHTVDSL